MEAFFTHLWKSAALITIFYSFYKLILHKETYFHSIRYFLLFGVVVSLTLPFLFITKYITVEAMPSILVNSGSNINTIPFNASINWLSIITYIYLTTTAILFIKFIFQLASIGALIYRSQCLKIDNLYMIETSSQESPFSFFNFIVYNPTHFRKEELNQIIAHEKAHAVQKHSFDTIFSNLLVVFLWFNPIVWFYRNKIEQNLEFIADEHAQKITKSQNTYQQLLLKTTIPNYQMAIANNFYNSLLKKRIIMLHKQRSNRTSQWKFVLIIPFLIAFIFAFNTKIVAQQKPTKKKIVKIHMEVFDMSINKKTSKDALNKIVDTFSEQGLTVKFSGIKRNKSNEIIAIKINAKTNDGKKSTSYAINDDESIKPIQISFDKGNNALSIASVDSHTMHSYTSTTKGTGTNVVLISDDEEHSTWVTKSGNNKMTIEIKEEHGDHEDAHHLVEEIIYADEDGNEVKKEIIKVKKGANNKYVFISDGQDKSPLIFLNGKEITKKDMEDLDTDSIANINVYKGDKAIEKYGKKAADGVIEITTKTKE